MKKVALRLTQWSNKGQSFVELAIVMMALMTLLIGMVEAGNLLNQYINLVDGVKEGARAASNHNPFNKSSAGDYTPSTSFYTTTIDGTIEGSWDTSTLQLEGGALAPIRLDPAQGDDIVISIYTVNDTGGTIRDTFPKEADVPVANRITLCNCWSVYGNKGSSMTQSKILAQLNSHATAPTPGNGILVVEIFYSYPTLLKWPLARIPVYAYAIMPLSAAEPTPLP